MLDLSEQESIPRYEIKLRDGTVKSFDAVCLAYKLRCLEGIEDPNTIREALSKELDISELDGHSALLLIQDFLKFTEDYVEGPLKNALEREPSSSTITDSRVEN